MRSETKGFFIMINVNKVIDYIEKQYQVTLTECQKDCLEHIIKGDTIYTPRAFGRSLLYKGYAEFLEKVLAKSVDYSIPCTDFDKVYTIDDVVKSFIGDKALSRIKEISPKRFDKDFMCKYET